MASRRMLESSVFESEFFGGLTMLQRVLWIGLVTRCADDQGRMIDNPIVIRSQVFPYDDIAVSEINDALEIFCGAGEADRYKDDTGRGYIQLTGWWQMQEPQWAMRSKYPAPAGWIDHVRMTVNGKYYAENWPVKGNKTSSPEQVAEPPEPTTLPPTNTVQPVTPPGHPTLSIEPVRQENENENENEKEKENEKSLEVVNDGFEKPPIPPMSREHSNVESVRIYRSLTGINPNSVQARNITAAVLNNELWEKTVEHWMGHGWKPENVRGMLDSFRKGGPDGCDLCHQANGKRPSNKRGQDYDQNNSIGPQEFERAFGRKPTDGFTEFWGEDATTGTDLHNV